MHCVAPMGSGRLAAMRHLAQVAVLVLLPSCVGAPEPADFVAEELSYPHLVEAEGATGAGTTVADAGASGGAFHRNAAVGTIAYAPYSAPDTLAGTVVVRARRTGSGTAQLNVRVDGSDLGAVYVTSSSWADYTVPTAANAPGGNRSVGLYFRTCSGSCVLEVDTVTFTLFEPTPIYTAALEAESATSGGTVITDSTASNGFYRAFTTNGATASLGFTTAGPIVSAVVRRRAGGASSCTPRGRVRIDGNTVFDGYLFDDGWNEHAFAVSRPQGFHTLEITAVAATVSCPIQFDVVTIGTIDPPPPPVLQFIEAEAAVGAGTVIADSGASNGQARRFTASYAGATVPGVSIATAPVSASVRVRASLGCSGAYGAVRVDGTDAWMGPVWSNAWTDVALTPGLFTVGSHDVMFYPRYVPNGCTLDFDAVTLTP